MPLPAAAPSRTLVSLANAVPNVFWSVLSIAPLGFYCYHHMARPWLYGLLLGHLLAYGLPTAWFSRWQLSRTPARYRRLGVPAVGRLTQHGEFMSRFIRRRYPRLRWSGRNGHGESNFPLSWEQQNQPENGREPSMTPPFGPRRFAA